LAAAGFSTHFPPEQILPAWHTASLEHPRSWHAPSMQMHLPGASHAGFPAVAGLAQEASEVHTFTVSHLFVVWLHDWPTGQSALTLQPGWVPPPLLHPRTPTAVIATVRTSAATPRRFMPSSLDAPIRRQLRARDPLDSSKFRGATVPNRAGPCQGWVDVMYGALRVLRTGGLVAWARLW
jgi:hypothetical protein